MVKLCLMASVGCPPGPGLAIHQEQNKVIKMHCCQSYLPSLAARLEITRLNSLNLPAHQYMEPWRTTSGFFESNQVAKIDSTTGRPVLIDVQDTRPDSILFSFGIAEQCRRHEKILQFLISGSSELERGALDLSVLSDLMGLQALTFNSHLQPYTPLIYSGGKFDCPKPLVDFVGDMARSSNITVHPDGRVLYNGNATDMKDILSVVAEFYLSKNSTTWRKQSMLVPQFTRLDTTEAHPNVLRSSLEVKDTAAAPLKSPPTIKHKLSPKRKNARKGCRERDLYKRTYFQACESLLSLMMDMRHKKTAILSLRKCGPELPELLTHFSAGIAGTGLAVLISVICQLSCARVPLSVSKLLNTGFGFGLVWLSCAVNGLRNTIVSISKNASKLNLKDEEMMMNKSLNDIYSRAATLVAVAVLRFA